jgi:hypothetical protein
MMIGEFSSISQPISMHAANTARCDDASVCTTADECDNRRCTGRPLDCDDDNPCTDDSCDPVTGCAHVGHEGACSDGDPCTSEETCVDGRCRGVVTSRGAIRAERTIINSDHMLPARAYDAVYAPGTAQNWVGAPGHYRFYIARGLEASRLPAGISRLRIDAGDTRGNRTVAQIEIAPAA